MITASSPASTLPPGTGTPAGIPVPPTPVCADQLAIAHRLHLIASTVPPRYPVTVTASDLLALLNGFWQESRRADVAETRLEALTARPTATPAPN